MRPFIAAANWKMFKNPNEAEAFFREFLPLIKQQPQKQIFLFPSAVCLHSVIKASQNTKINIGAQNCHWANEGAFTGETSPRTIKQMGAHSVLVGHSERRTLFNESDDFLSKKVKAAQDNGLVPMLCVGETLQEREAGKTEQVIARQLKEGLKDCNFAKDFLIAYEPVWAIGTGKVASTEQAEQAHAALRKALSELAGEKTALATCILYGGSVKPNNASELAKQPNIDGFLVGGASLIPQDFAAIFNVEI